METYKIRELDPDIIRPRLQDVNNPSADSGRIFIIGKGGSGKCFGENTPILMYNGKTKFSQNIILGDKLMGDDNKPRTVLALGTGTDNLYKISHITTGDSYIVNSLHTLTLKNDDNVVDIPLVKYLDFQPDIQRKFKGFQIPIEFPLKTVFNPYSIGVWIAGFNHFSVLKYGRYPSQFLKTLHRYSLYNKLYIPEVYLLNSRRNRLLLLAGFIDIIGASYKNIGYTLPRSQFEEYRQLFTDLIFLIKSLGIKTTIDKKRIILSGNGVDEIPTLYTYKPHVSKQSYHLDSELNIEDLGIDKYYGFQVDGNGRFLLGNFIVTHNSELLRYILYAKRSIFPCGIVMSGTESSNHFYEEMFPKSFIYNELDEEALKNFMNKRQVIAKNFLQIPWNVCILDDVTDDPKIFNHKIMSNIMKNGRHYAMLFVVIIQYCMDMKPAVRNLIDGVFIFQENSVNTRKKLWENYAGIIPTLHLFNVIMDQVTGDYCALYIDNRCKSTDWRNAVYWCKAPMDKIPRNFRVGSKEYWDFHEERYNSKLDGKLFM